MRKYKNVGNKKKMRECETAQKLWKKVCEEGDKATFTGYGEDYTLAIEAYIGHIFKPTITTSMLLQMFSSEGDLVLDPFAGFGSIPLVREIFNRRWIAFEIDKRKYDIAVKFIKERKVGEIKIENNKNVQTKLIGGINKHLV